MRLRRAALVLLASLISFDANAIRFNNNVAPYQSDFRGVNAVHMGFCYLPELASYGMTTALCAEEAARASRSGSRMARTWLDVTWACPSYWAGGCDWNSTKMTAFYSWLSDMRSYGINVAVTTGWHFAGNVCAVSDGVIPTCTPSASDENSWKAWVSEVLNQIINVRGYTNVNAAHFFTEPNVSPAGIPGGYTAVEYYEYLVGIAKAQIVADDAGRTPILPRVTIVGPSEFSFTTDTWTEHIVANAPTLVGTFAAHSYCNTPNYTPLGLVGNNCAEYAGWNSMFANWVGDAAPKPLWVDETGAALTQGDYSEYRMTGDYGWQLVRLLNGHMEAGAQSTFVWMLQDQRWTGTAGYYQHWGMCGWMGDTTTCSPSFSAVSILANLTGDGGADLYRAGNVTIGVHGTGVTIPYGARNCNDTAGCMSFVLINEGTAIGSSVQFQKKLPATGSTSTRRPWYRYVFNGEAPPRPMPGNPSYLVPWDMRFTDVRTIIPATTIPGHSVVVYSTINLAEPLSVNQSVNATATASSSSFGKASNVADGNASRVLSTLSSWSPTASGNVTLTWTSSVSMNRIELAFAGTSDPIVYATYADTTHPTVPDTYTVQYWNGSTYVDFVPAINVSSNTQVQRTHTFANVSTTRVRFTNAGAAALNELGVYNDPSPPDTALGHYGYTDNTSNPKSAYERISTTGVTFQSGDVIQYDVRLLDRKAGMGAIDVTVDAGCAGAFSTLGSAWKDQNNVNGDPVSDLSGYAYGTWFTRSLVVPACAVGRTSTAWMLATARNDRVCTSNDSPCTAGTYYGAPGTTFYDNIVVRRGGATVATIYADGAPSTIVLSSKSRYPTSDVFVMPR